MNRFNRDAWRQLAITLLTLILSLPPSSVLANPQEQKKPVQEDRGIKAPSSSATTPESDQLSSTKKPEVVIQSGHSKPVNTIAFSPDGTWLASGANDDTIKIWDTSAGYVLRTFYGHSSNVNALAVSPDGRLLASGSGDMISTREIPTFKRGGIVGGARDNTVRIWDVQSGREIRTLRGHVLPVGGVAFSSDGRTVTSASGDAVKVWDIASGNELRSQQTKYDKSGMEKWDSFRSFSIFGRDKRETQQAEWQKNLKLSASRIIVNPQGQFAAVGQPDKGIWIYDASTGRALRELIFKALPETEHSSVAFSAEGRLVAFAKTSDTVTVQEAATGREIFTVNTRHSAAPQRVSFSPSGRFLVTATDPGGGSDRPLVKLFDGSTGQLIRELNSTVEPNHVRVISFSNDERFIAVAASGSKRISVIDVATGTELRVLRAGAGDENASAPMTAFLNSIDPKTLADLQSRGIRSPEQIVDAIEALGAVANEKFPFGNAVSMSPDGRYIISRRLLLKSVVTETWDTKTGTPVRIQEPDPFRERGKPHFSPDGRYRAAPDFPMKGIYTTSAHDYNFFSSDDWDRVYDQKITIFDGKSGRKLRELNGGKAADVGIVPAFGFSFDGRLAAMTGFDNKAPVVFVYETASGRKVKRLDIAEESGAVAALTVSANAQLLAIAHTTKIDLFDISTGRSVRTLPHKGRVSSLTFSHDDRFLVALGENNEKYIWNPATGEKLATLINLTGSLSGQINDWLVVTPDGLFDGSPSGWSQILWQFGGNTFDVNPGETFFNEFYYPGLLGEIMSGRKPRAPKNISQLDRRQPELTLAAKNESGSEKIAERNLRVTIEVREKPSDKNNPTGSGAKDLRLFRNGSLVKIWRGDILKGQPAATLEATIPVVAGENRLTAYAFNRDNVKSKDAGLNLVGSENLRRERTAYVLAIGINSYENPQYNLKYAIADAQSFASEFRQQQQKLSRYQHIEIITLTDQEATKANILLALKLLAGAGGELPDTTPASLKRITPAQPEDSVMIFYAGHGTAQGQRFYLIPHDLGYQGERTALDAAGLQTILSRSISDTELEHTVENLDVSNLVLVIDACNSGQALEAEEKRRGPMNSKGLAQLAYEKGMYILTAAQGYQAALESAQLGHGYLTYALVEEGLKTVVADTSPPDKLVSVREWLDFATERVPQLHEEKLKSRDLALQSGSADAGAGGRQKKNSIDAEISDLQRPRAFYRREIEPEPLIVARP